MNGVGESKSHKNDQKKDSSHKSGSASETFRK